MALRPPLPLPGWEAAVRSEDLALARAHPSYGRRLTDDTFAQLCDRGFAIVEGYLPEEQRAAMAAALRKILPPLDELLEAVVLRFRSLLFFHDFSPFL